MAYAKVNLSLHVGKRRPDGLHQIHSIFQSVSLADQLRIEQEPDSRIDTVVCRGVDGPNIVGDALAKFRGITGWKGPALRVSVDKQIPIAAGLGGGSADAAAVLRVVNEIAADPLDIEGLRRLGAAIGSDVPSQILPGLYLVTGAGERLEPQRAIDEFALVLLPVNKKLSTADVYRQYDLQRHSGEIDDQVDPGQLRGEIDLNLLAGESNDLENTVIEMALEVPAALEEMKKAGALASRVSGSGPTVFGIFESFDSAESAARKLAGIGSKAVKPVCFGSGHDFGRADQ